MKKLWGIVQIIAAIGLAVFLVVGWGFLGDYYVTLKFLPDVPLFGGRLLVGLAAVGFIVSGVGALRGDSEDVADPAIRILE
jgi:hypothetical protein